MSKKEKASSPWKTLVSGSAHCSRPKAKKARAKACNAALSCDEKEPGSQRPRRSRYNSVEWCSLAPCADRKSTRLNSSHTVISYAVFCLKKKKKKKSTQ